jgi:DNA-binding CsgD family transcriptional regulator
VGALDLAALEMAVEQSAFPALLMQVPAQRVIAASPAATQLLSPQGEAVVGRLVDDFMMAAPSGALPLLMSGRLDGYEAAHELDQPGGPVPVTLWVRRADSFDPPRHVVAILTVADQATTRLLPKAPGRYVPPVLGSTGPDMLIDRISSDIDKLVGIPAERMLGRSLLTLVTPESASGLLWGLAQASTHGRGAPLRLELVRADGAGVYVQFLVVPLHPPASCAFSILPTVPGGGPDMMSADAHDLLAQLATGIDALGTARQMAGISASNRRLLSSLSARELDVVTRLHTGDRVPTIAKALFLSPSTVRNQLSSVFTKTGVHSQQELLDLLRDQGGLSGEQ